LFRCFIFDCMCLCVWHIFNKETTTTTNIPPAPGFLSLQEWLFVPLSFYQLQTIQLNVYYYLMFEETLNFREHTLYMVGQLEWGQLRFLMVTFECICKFKNKLGKCDNSNSGTRLGKHKSLIFNMVCQMVAPRLSFFALVIFLILLTRIRTRIGL